MCIENGCKLEPCDEWRIAMDLTKPILTARTTPNLKWEIYPSSGDFLVWSGIMFV